MNKDVIDNSELNSISTMPQKTIMLFRCTKRAWAEQLCRGEIYLSSPQQWISLGEKHIDGQGDMLEGVFFSTKDDDDSDIVRDLKSDNTLDYFIQDNFLYFRRKEISNLRCLCMYGLHEDAFEKTIATDGKAHYKAKIPREYFAGFSPYQTKEECERIPKSEQPVVVFINNLNEFFNRIRKSLVSIGVIEDEIIITPVVYFNRRVRSFSMAPFPLEMRLKDKSFENQSEVRIIVNSKNPNYLDYMSSHNNVISVGSLDDITTIYEYYFNDMNIERIGNKSIAFSLPSPVQFSINDLNFFELENLLGRILQGTFKFVGTPDKTLTWEEEIKPIIDLFYTKFGVIVSVDENKHVSMYNMSQELLEQSRKVHRIPMKQQDFESRIAAVAQEENARAAYIQCQNAIKDPELVGVAFFCMGKINSLFGNNQRAIQQLNQAYKEDYRRVDSLNEIASILFKQGEYEKAIEIYMKIQDEEGYMDKIWDNVGLCLLRLKRFKEADECFDKAIASNSKDAFSLYNKAVVLLSLGQKDQAKHLFEKSLMLEPSYEKDFLLYKKELYDE